METLIYIISISLQLSGGILLMTYSFSTQRLNVIKYFAGKGIILKNGDTSEIIYNESAFKNSFRTAYNTKFSIMFIIMGYFLGVFGNIEGCNKFFISVSIVVFTILIISFTYVIIEKIILKSNEINKKITSEELELAGIKPDMESISSCEMDIMLDRIFKD